MAETINMPKLGFDMQEGTLVRWVRTEGESISKGDVLAEIETDKATVEVESSASGIIRKLLVDQGAIVPIGAPIAIVGTKDEKIEAPSTTVLASETPSKPEVDTPPTAAPLPAPKPEAAADMGPSKASPLARRMAREAAVDLARIQGSGPGGRIIRRDIEAAITRGGDPSIGVSCPRVVFAVRPAAGSAGDEAVGADSGTAPPLTQSPVAALRVVGRSPQSRGHSDRSA